MTDSILNSIKKVLNIPVADTAFDVDLILHINSVFMTLNQLGVGPEAVFSIEDNTATWTSFVDDINKVSAVKSYMALRVRLLFDPPATSFLLESIKNMILEHEWRLCVQMTPPPAPVIPEEGV